jgi:putative ABC transport system permease protein
MHANSLISSGFRQICLFEKSNVTKLQNDSIEIMAGTLPGFIPMLRGLFKHPAFSLLAVLTLALGIGINVAIFSALEAVVINPLPFPRAHELVAVYEDASWLGYYRNTPAPANFFDWRRQARSFQDMAAMSFGCNAVLSGDGPAEEVRCGEAMANLWPLLGVSPIIGSWFTAADDHPQPNTLLIGEGLWTRRFGRDHDIVNRTILVNGQGMRITGVMPGWFHFPSEAELWLPLGLSPKQMSQRGSHYLRCYGRLKTGVSVAQASEELKLIQQRLNKAYPKETNPRMGAWAEALQTAMVGDMRRALWILMAASAMVLLIACAGIANLLLARATARQRELAVRTALGASWTHLAGQVIFETVMLAILGGGAGVAVAFASRRLIENFIPEALKGSITIALDPRVLSFALIASLIAALLAAVTPVLHVLRTPLVNVLRQDLRTGASRNTVRIRSALVITEVAIAVALLAGAGLLIRSLMAIWSTSLGFRPDSLMTVRISLPAQRYVDDQKRFQFYERALQAVRAIPGIATADFASIPPFFSIGYSRGFAIEGRTETDRWEPGDMLTRPGTPGYLQTLGATLASGRYFAEADRDGVTDVVIVNETFEQTFFGGQSAVNKRMSFSGTDLTRHWRVIVGVVKDINERGYDYAAKPVTYVPLRQNPGGFASQLMIRSLQGSPDRFVNGVRKAIQSIDPDQPIGQALTYGDILARDQASRRQQMFLLTAFAGVSLALACLGVYAILSYTVELRRQEIGIRMALGAGRADLLRMVAVDGMRLAAWGTLFGMCFALGGSRLLRASLYGVQPFDPVTLAGVSTVLVSVALLASWIPARRAARMAPMDALRS